MILVTGGTGLVGAHLLYTLIDNNEEVRAICAELNHEETEICTSIEREFLNLLDGDSTAPIGALAFIKEEGEEKTNCFKKNFLPSRLATLP